MITPDLSHRPAGLKLAADLSSLLPYGCTAVLLVRGHTRRVTVYLLTMACVYLLKGVLQLLTILPASRSGCWGANSGDELPMMLHSSEWVYTTAWGGSAGCNDMIFSGHTASVMLGMLSINKSFVKHGVGWLSVVLVLFQLGYIWVILSMRMHYSVDLALAILLCGLLYTHTPFRYALWVGTNRLVRNPEWSGLKEHTRLRADRHSAPGRLVGGR